MARMGLPMSWRELYVNMCQVVLCGPSLYMQSEMNRKRLRQLYSAAQVEMKRQATKAKLEEVDKDIAKWLQVMQVVLPRPTHCVTYVSDPTLLPW